MNRILGQSMAGHTCQRGLFISTRVTTKVDDSLIFLGGWRFYKVIETPSKEDQRIRCNRIFTRPYDPGYGVELGLVGVYIFDKYEEDVIVLVRRVAVRGKAVLVASGNRQFIVAAPTNVLNEGH